MCYEYALNNKLKLFVNFFYTIIICTTVIIAFYSITSRLQSGFLLMLPIVTLALFLCTKLRMHMTIKRLQVGWCILQIISTVVMLYMAFSLEVDFSWDWGGLIKSASDYVLLGQCDLEYFARYPNNSFWMIFLVGFFAVIKFFWPDAVLDDFKNASIVLSCLLVQLSIFLIYQTAKMIWNEKKGFLAGAIAIFFAPFYLFALFAYTDTAGCLTISLFLYLHIKSKSLKDKSVFLAIIRGIAAAFVFQIKVMGFIVCIAAFIDSILSMDDFKKWIKISAICILSLFICFAGLKTITGFILPITDEMIDKYEFPPVHWIMMGSNDGGGYNSEDVSYTMSFPTYKEKCDADIDRIRERFAHMGVAGTLKHIYMGKLKGLWGFGSLGAEFYINRLPLHKEKLVYNLFAFGGRYHYVGMLYTELCWALILIGIVSVAFRKHGSSISYVGKLTLIGVILFFSFWESNSRYLFVFAPVIILLSVDGWFFLRDYLVKRRAKK